MEPAIEQDGAVRSAQHVKTRLRMKDLVQETDIPRETIHFYIAQGLLPRPQKTGRNTAVYSQEHLQRLHKIRELQQKHFLPLRAIKAILDENTDEQFTTEQENLLREIRLQIGGRANTRTQAAVPVSQFLTRVAEQDLQELHDAGFIEIFDTQQGAAIAEQDAQIIEAWAQLQEAGITRERGFAPTDLAILEQAIDKLVRQEMAILAEHYVDASGSTAAEVIERALPVLNRLLGTLHHKHIWRFIAEFEAKAEQN